MDCISLASKRVLFVTLSSGMLLLGPSHVRSAESQEACVNQPVGVTNPAQLIPLLDSTGECSVDGIPSSTAVVDGSWVKADAINLLQGAIASTTGACIVKYKKGPACYSPGTYPRYLMSVWTGNTQRGAGNLPLRNESPPAGPHPSQQLDTTVLGSTNGPFLESASIQGSHTFRWFVETLYTVCNIELRIHPVETITFNALDCKPNWWIEQNPDGTFVPGSFNYQAPPGMITIAVPPGFDPADQPARDAAAAWGKALGRTITVASNSTCSPSLGGLCVGMKEDHGTLPGDPAGCASLGTSSPDPSTGAWTGTMYVRFSPGWKSAHPTRIQWTIAHELGHYFGLFNQEHSSCNAENTVMSAGSCNSPDAVPSGVALGPTGGDAATLNNSTYGDKNRLVCGW
jgi:hypothetical protein